MTTSDDGIPVRREGARVLPGRRGRRVLAIFLVVLLSLIGLALLLVFWVLPWLGRRGDLNAPIEDLIRSALNLPVKIASIETDPMSRLAITHMSSIRAGTGRRFEFECERISVLYSPWDLWSGHRVEEFIVVRPRLRIDLNTDLSGILAVPKVPAPEGEPGPTAPEADTSFGIGHFSLQMGELQLDYGGQTLLVDELNIDVFGLGDADHTRFHADAKLGKAELMAEGRITGQRSSTGERSFHIYDSKVLLRNLDVGPFFALVEGFVPGLRGHGRVDLVGDVNGIWPRKVSVDLESSLEGFSAATDEPVVDQGVLGLAVHADAIDEMARVDFTVKLDGEGQSYGLERELHLIAEGTFEKDSDDGLLTLGGSSRLVSPEIGEMRFDGAVRSLLAEPVVDLRARASEIDVAVALRRLPGSWSVAGSESARGRLGFELSLKGPVESPVLEGEWALEGGGFALPGGPVIHASMSGSVERVEGLFEEEETPVASGVVARIRDLGLAPLATSTGFRPEELTFDGSATVELSTLSWRLDGPPDELRLHASVEDFEGSLRDGLIATEDAELSLDARLTGSIDVDSGAREWVVESDLQVKTPLLLIGSVEEVLDEEPARLTGRWTFSRRGPAGRDRGEGDVEASPVFDARAALTLDWPTLGQVGIDAVSTVLLSPRLRVLPLRLDMSAAAVSNERFLGTYLRDTFQERFSFLKGARFGGRSALDLRLEILDDGVTARGHVTSRDTSLGMPVVGLAADGVHIDLPLRFGGGRGEASRGSIGIGTLRLGQVEVEKLELPFRHDGASYHVDPVEFELLGGTVRMDHLTVEPSGVEGAVDLSLGLDRMDLAELSGALGWPRMEGSVGGDLRRVRVAGDRLAILGGLRVHAFGGEIEFRDLTVEEFTEPYFTASLGSGRIRELDLQTLGEVFRFGLISGVLEGAVENLVFTPGHLLRFDVDLQTVERSGVGQIIDLRAIESVQRALSGRFAGLESFFSRFHYKGFGFEAHLRGKEFRLRGKYTFDGVEHLMYSRWWQFPRVRIINTRPGQSYDWKRIQENVKKVFRESTDEAGSKPGNS